MSIYAKFHNSIASYYASLTEQYSAKYLRATIIGVVVVTCLVAGYFLNKFYVQYREQKAFVALSEVVDAFAQSKYVTQSLDPQKDKEKIALAWQDTEILLDALHKEHNNSYLAPYFLVFKSQIALERDHDLQQAIKILDDALVSIPKKSELGSLYHLKRIKMGFDSANAQDKEQALQDLIKITQDADHYGFEEALYLLGVYYIATNQATNAQQAFQKLVDQADSKALLKSPWVQLAQEKLGIVPMGTIPQSSAE